MPAASWLPSSVLTMSFITPAPEHTSSVVGGLTTGDGDADATPSDNTNHMSMTRARKLALRRVWRSEVKFIAGQSTVGENSLMKSLFHLAFHVTDLDTARRFYGDTLGCAEGRSTDTWVDFNFFSHQISLHLGEPFKTTRTGRVGEHWVPMPHFGLVLPLADWQALAARLQAVKTAFVLEPQVRYPGEPGEQWTMFFCDPFGNPIEIKGLASMDGLYAA